MNLGYGRGHLSLRLDLVPDALIFEPEPSPQVELCDKLKDAISNPIGSKALEHLLDQKKRVAVCIPDKTRPRVARMVLKDLISWIEASGVKRNRISVIIASGSHSRHSDADIKDLIGDEIKDLDIKESIGANKRDFGFVGQTSRGTPVWLNRFVLDADLVILLTSVVTHYFAGWGGGRKMILPGVAHLESIWANHRLTLTDEGDISELCGCGRLDGNPVHEDMIEAAAMLADIFCINIVLDGWGRPVGLTAGDLVKSHLSAVEIAKGFSFIRVPKRCKLAIASAGGYPFDIDLIQSHKAIDHIAECMEDDAALVMAVECSDGFGSKKFISWFDLGGTKEVGKRLLDNYELNGHTALALMKKTERFSIILISSLERDVVEKMGMIPASSIEEGIGIANRIVGHAPLTYVFPHASGVVPIVDKNA